MSIAGPFAATLLQLTQSDSGDATVSLVTPPSRNLIFVTHAAPEDNEFALWISSKLAMAGYRAWVDRRRLRGGADFWDEINRVLRPAGLLYVSEPVYAGGFNDIVRLFHDEKAQRTAAYRALIEAVGRAESLDGRNLGPVGERGEEETARHGAAVNQRGAAAA